MKLSGGAGGGRLKARIGWILEVCFQVTVQITSATKFRVRVGKNAIG